MTIDQLLKGFGAEVNQRRISRSTGFVYKIVRVSKNLCLCTKDGKEWTDDSGILIFKRSLVESWYIVPEVSV